MKSHRMATSLQITLVAVIFLLAVAPAALISTFLIKQFEQIQADEQIQKLSAQASNVAQRAQFDLAFFHTRFKHTSEDNILALAAYTGTFGERARQKMASILVEHKLVSALVLVDNQHVTLSAVPTAVELIEFTQLQALLNDKTQKNVHAELSVHLINSPSLMSSIRQRTATNDVEYKSNNILIYIAPLIMTDSRKTDKFSKLTGLVVAFVPVENIFAELDQDKENMLLTSITQENTPLILGESADVINIINVSTDLDIEGISKDWQANFVRTRKEAFQNVYQLTDKFFLVATLFIFALILIALLISRTLVKPLAELNTIIERYVRRDYTPTYSPIRFREIQQIVNVLATMADQIQFDQKVLEDRVRQRTEDLLETNQELSEAMNQLTIAQDQLIEKEKMSLLGQLVAGIAHEINTPLGICVTASSTLNSKLKEMKSAYEKNTVSRRQLEEFLAQFDEGFCIILNNIQRAATLIQNFKAIAVDSTSEQRREFKLKSYIEEAIHSLAPELRQYQITIAVEGDESLILNNYPGAFAQILTNLIINSLRHGFDKELRHTIHIDFFVEQNTLHLSYCDDGRGVAAEQLQKLFDPFYTTLSNQGGSGLGLNIVYNIVTSKLMGDIHANSSSGSGLCFDISVPLDSPNQD